MFKNLLGFWKGKDFIAQVFDDFKKMLDQSTQMFSTVTEHLLVPKDDPNLKQKIHAIDHQINVLQKDIRKRIVQHLTLQPTVEVTACLVLMSVVKDAERLGDYCKNLYEVSGLAEGPINRDLYEAYFNGLDQEILTLFAHTQSAFIDADEDKARATWEFEQRIAKGCDKIVERLAQSDITVTEAVCFTLIARHYKRIVAHLVNIATSVILPLQDLDYWDEQRD